MTLNFSQNGGKALGQEIFVYGIVKDEFGKPQSNVLIEIWQANSGGKYRHQSDNNDVSLDPNFAAVMVDLMNSLNIKARDTVAVLMTGSMPGANLAVLSACKAMEITPIIISSLGAPNGVQIK